MRDYSPEQIADAVFNDGPWWAKNPRDLTLRRGLQNLAEMGFSAEEVRQHRQAVQICGLVIIANKYIHNRENDATIPELLVTAALPVEFDLEKKSGFRAECEDGFTQLEVQHYLDSREFQSTLKAAYLEELTHAAVAEATAETVREAQQRGMTFVSGPTGIQ